MLKYWSYFYLKGRDLLDLRANTVKIDDNLHVINLNLERIVNKDKSDWESARMKEKEWKTVNKDGKNRDVNEKERKKLWLCEYNTKKKVKNDDFII